MARHVIYYVCHLFTIRVDTLQLHSRKVWAEEPSRCENTENSCVTTLARFCALMCATGCWPPPGLLSVRAATCVTEPRSTPESGIANIRDSLIKVASW